jgi:hypothetical protein
LKCHVVDPLAQVGTLALHLVLCLVNSPPQLAHLFLESIDPGQQLRHEVAAAGRCLWIRAAAEIGWGTASPARLILERLHLTPEFKDLILQRYPLAALDLRDRRHR